MVKTDEAVLNNIVTDYFVFGKSQATIAGEQGVGATTVLGIVRAFDAVKNENWDECIRLYNTGVSAHYFTWSAKRLDKSLPEKVENAISRKRRGEVAVNEPATEKKNENIYLIRILEELAKHNELMQQLIDVVIPKYTEDTRVAIMKNAVVLCNKFQHTIDDVSAMKDVLGQIHEELK